MALHEESIMAAQPPLLPCQAPADCGGDGGFPWLTPPIGFLFAYANLLCLFLCLRQLERVEPAGSITSWKLQAAMSVLTRTLPILLLSHKCAAIVPDLVQILVWGMAFPTVLGGFYALFVHEDKEAEDDAEDATLFTSERAKIVRGLMLAPLRWRSPGTASGSRAHDQRDIAWSGTRLIVDSGATRHAVCNILLLEGFQPYRPHLVATLADGTSVRILGAGRIQWGSFNIPNVSLVQGLQDGLISTQQLDNEHSLISCFANGICRIMQADGTEVGGAILDLQEGGYLLRFLDVPGTSQQ